MTNINLFGYEYEYTFYETLFIKGALSYIKNKESLNFNIKHYYTYILVTFYKVSRFFRLGSKQ